MSIEAIYASKLYKASSRKDKIKATISNPINKELVLQLEEYLDDKYTSESDEDISLEEFEPDTESESSDSDSHESIRPSVHTKGESASHTSSADHHLSEMLSDEEDSESSAAASDDESNPEASAPEESAEPLHESTTISQPSIMSATELACETDSIAGLLNSRDDTAGVCRCIVSGNELWIHYEDKINLNNVMEPVIAVLNASNYSFLDFNRLARTQNAIVFFIAESPKSVEPVGDLNEG